MLPTILALITFFGFTLYARHAWIDEDGEAALGVMILGVVSSAMVYLLTITALFNITGLLLAEAETTEVKTVDVEYVSHPYDIGTWHVDALSVEGYTYDFPTHRIEVDPNLEQEYLEVSYNTVDHPVFLWLFDKPYTNLRGNQTNGLEGTLYLKEEVKIP